MAFHTFGPGLALDKITMRGLSTVIARLEDAETGEVVQAFTMGDDPEAVPVTTNRYGYFGQFQVDESVRRLRLTFGRLTLEHTAWELLTKAATEAAQAKADAELARIAAQQAAALVGAPADTAIATILNGVTTLTRIKLDSLYASKDAIPARINRSANWIVDELNERDDAWGAFQGGPDTGWVTSPIYGAAKRSQKLTPKTQQSNMASYAAMPSPRMNVRPGEWVRASSMVMSDGIDSTMATVGQRIYFYDAAGVLMGGVGNSDGGAILAANWTANQWLEVGNVPVQVPVGAATMAPRVTIYRATNAPAQTTNFYVGPVSVGAAIPAVTTTRDGTMLAADKAKLDGLNNNVATGVMAGLMPASDKAKLDGATAAATASRIPIRDANGTFLVTGPTAAGHPTTKDYVDKLGATQDIPAGISDLNTYQTDGFYRQALTANAVSGSNYPVGIAGLLTVRNLTNMTFQEYRTYGASNRRFWRSRYNTDWSPWKEEVDTVTLADEAGRIANQAITTSHKPTAGAVPEFYLTVFRNGDKVPGSIRRIVGGDSNATAPPQETIASYYAKTGGTVLINASGWWTGLGNKLMGLSIKNGTLIQGWEASGDLGNESVVIMRDGELRVYAKDTTPDPATIIAAGGYNAFSWGAAAYRDGAVTNFRTKYTRYSILSARQCIGSTTDGHIFILTIPGTSGSSGAGGDGIVAAAQATGLAIRHLYILDGGGSAQTFVGGLSMVPSSDGTQRPVPDALYFYGPLSSPVMAKTAWTAIDTRGTGFTGGAVEYKVTDEAVWVRVINVAASGTGALRNVSTLPPQVPRPLWNITGLAYLNTKTENGQNARIGPDGNIDVSNSLAGSVSWFTSYPVER